MNTIFSLVNSSSRPARLASSASWYLNSIVQPCTDNTCLLSTHWRSKQCMFRFSSISHSKSCSPFPRGRWEYQFFDWCYSSESTGSFGIVCANCSCQAKQGCIWLYRCLGKIIDVETKARSLLLSETLSFLRFLSFWLRWGSKLRVETWSLFSSL